MKRILIFIAVIGAALGLVALSPVDRYFEIAKNMEIFAAAFREINASYIEEVNPNKLIKEGINGALESLDPYTNFIPEDEIEDYRAANTGQHGGIGITVGRIGGSPTVIMLFEGYPAAQAGVKVGDELIKAGEVELSPLLDDEIRQLIQGQVGSTLRLTLRRLGTPELIETQVERRKIRVDNVLYYDLVGEGIGYIKLTGFTHKASKEVKDAVLELKRRGASRLTLDLRGNPGGLLLEAIDICGLFLPKGSRIVTTRGKMRQSNEMYSATEEPLDLAMPIAALIDKGSASAAEIVAGSLQDYDRAVIVGETSFGKGLVQISRPLPYNAQLKVTTARYYTPSGRCIQTIHYGRQHTGDSAKSAAQHAFKTQRGRVVYDEGGVTPDVEMPAKQLHALSQALYDSGALFRYATLYASRRKTIAPARDFALSRAEYEDFKTWIRQNPQLYRSALARQLDEFEAVARRERRFAEVKPAFDALSQATTRYENERLDRCEPELKPLLERLIAAHFYMERGALEASFKHDKALDQSINLLQDAVAYQRLLSAP